MVPACPFSFLFLARKIFVTFFNSEDFSRVLLLVSLEIGNPGPPPYSQIVDLDFFVVVIFSHLVLLFGPAAGDLRNVVWLHALKIKVKSF